MSDYYLLQLELVFDRDVDVLAVGGAVAAAHAAIPPSGYDTVKRGVRYTMCAVGDIAGDTPEEIAKRIRDSIWEAAGCFVDVTLRAARLDDVPYTVIHFGKDDYEQLVSSPRKRLIISDDVDAPKTDSTEV